MDRLLPTMNIGVPEGERGRGGSEREREGEGGRREGEGGREEKIGEGRLNLTIFTVKNYYYH